MNVWGEWEFSSESEDRLNKICLKFEAKKSQVFNDWLALLYYNSSASDSYAVEIGVATICPQEVKICNLLKETIESEVVLSEATFIDISINSLSRILMTVKTFLNEYQFCFFCKCIASWSNDTLVEYSLKLIVLAKLKEINESSSCIIFSIKELARSKPDQLCQNVFIPLLSENTFTDVELLSGIFSVFPVTQKELLILNFIKKPDIIENDWIMLHPLIKDLSQNSMLKLLDCIQKFSFKFTKSLVFGRFLVNFCKNIQFIGNKNVLREVIDKHQTLLKTQAIKYLELNFVFDIKLAMEDSLLMFIDMSF